jgi:hypothetical protein
MAQQTITAEHLARMAQKVGEQIELAPLKLQRLARPGDAARTEVDDQVTGLEAQG